AASNCASSCATNAAPHRIYNVGNHSPVPLLEFIKTLERVLGRTATKVWLPMQPGDMQSTYADNAALKAAVGFSPSTPLETGLTAFTQWYTRYHVSPKDSHATAA